MQVINQTVTVLTPLDGPEMLRRIEKAGRTCYRSESRITEDSATKFVKMLLKRKHLSVLEHEQISVRITCDRAIANELVRHRIGAYSQESTRYCNYGEGIKVIEPPGLSREARGIWEEAMAKCEHAYQQLTKTLDYSPQIARAVLPLCLATQIVATFNLRQWRHVFSMRLDKAAHPQIRELMKMILLKFHRSIPVVFDEFSYNYLKPDSKKYVPPNKRERKEPAKKEDPQ